MSNENRRKVNIGELELGMFVCDLDIPWSETTYPLQGFFLQTEQDIEKLVKICKFVFIDLNRSQGLKKTTYTVEERRAALQKSYNKKLKPYNDSSPWKNEYPKAKEAINSLAESVQQVFSSFSKNKSIDLQKIKKSVDPMIESISRNPDACIWLARMKSEDNYTYEHSVSSSIWAVALGRQIGFDKQDLQSLALGALLFDIGKLGVDQELLKAQRKLNEDEYRHIQTHVGHSLKMAKGLKDLNRNVLSMIEQHHERHNGSGYPHGLQGDDIHIFARIAAIADCYDAITSNRSYAEAITPTEAIKKLYQWRNTEFQAELVEEFIQAIGIYPAGSLVELSTGEVAIVLAEYRTRRLRPEVLVLLDKEKKPLKKGNIIKLYEQEHDQDGNALNIVSSLEPHAYGIDMQSIRL